MRVLVVDDEPLARERLKRLLMEMEQVEVCGEAGNGSEAVRYTEKLSPDIVLMDIRMPGMDGLEAARHLAQFDTPPAVVFTTAYGDHALDAFEARAVDYVLKPIRKERLEAALLRAQRLTEVSATALHSEQGVGARSHMCVRQRGDLQLVPVEEIRYFRADSKYVTMRSSDAELLIEESLKSLEQEFGERFIRIHRNALVARRYLAGLEKGPEGQCLVCLVGIDDRLDVSRRHLSELRRLLKDMGPLA